MKQVRRTPGCNSVAKPSLETSKPSAEQDTLKVRRTCLPQNRSAPLHGCVPTLSRRLTQSPISAILGPASVPPGDGLGSDQAPEEKK